mgnify:FL=1
MTKTCLGCEVVIKTWTDPMHFPEEKIKPLFQTLGISDSVVEKMQEKDVLCKKCGNKAFCRHAVVIYNYNKSQLLPEEFEALLKSGEDWIPMAQAELASSPQTQISETTTVNAGMTVPSSPMTNKAGKITTAEELTRLTDFRHDQTKAQWNKNGIVQYKDEGIAILQRRWGSQVQFIVACSQVTKEGYRLMVIDEGKEGSSGGFSGGVNAYFYFQRMDYVR